MSDIAEVPETEIESDGSRFVWEEGDFIICKTPEDLEKARAEGAARLAEIKAAAEEIRAEREAGEDPPPEE